MEKNILTKEEEQTLRHHIQKMESEEKRQVEELFIICNNPYQFAKTHSNYVKDWEKTRKHIMDNLEKGILPPGSSLNLTKEVLRVSDEIIQRKLELVRILFESKFGESIYNYLGPDGKTKKIFGIFG